MLKISDRIQALKLQHDAKELIISTDGWELAKVSFIEIR